MQLPESFGSIGSRVVTAAARRCLQCAHLRARTSGRWVVLVATGAVVGFTASPALALTNGLSYLKIGVGTRAVAMGNAVVSHIDGPSATYWNPGALALMGGSQAELMHNESFQTVRYEFATLTHRRDRHGFGASFHGVWTDNLRGYDEAGSFTGDFSYAGIVASGTYAFALNDRLGVGAGIEYLREQIDIDDATGTAFNFGVQAREILPRLDAGVSVRHLGSSMKYDAESFDLPATVQGGVTYRIPVDPLNGGLRVALEFQSVTNEDSHLLIGTEYAYQDFTRLQLGYRSGMDSEDLSFGFAVGREQLNAQYAFVPFDHNLGDQHRFSVLLAW